MIDAVDAVDVDDATLKAVASRMSGTLVVFSFADGRLAAHGCDLLTDDADWDAPTWSMQAAAMDELVGAWSALFDVTPSAITVTAIWSDDEIESEEQVSREGLLDITRRGALGTHTRYTVRGAEA